MTTALHWFRNDLRPSDNYSLTMACRAQRVLAVYFFDPRYFEKDPYGFPRTGNYRAQFLRETVSELSKNLRELKIPLFVYRERPEEVLPEMVARFGITEIHTQKEWTRDETQIRDAVLSQLPGDVRLLEHYDQFLFHPEDIPYEDFCQIPDVFTQFRKACEKQATVRKCLPLPEQRPGSHWREPIAEIPDLETLGLQHFKRDPRSAFPFRGGSTAARDRLNSYFWEEKRLSFYKKTRNGLLGADYSSKFAPWLSNGSLSAREVYHQVRKYERKVLRSQDTYWLIFELIWRDYFKYVSLRHGDRIFHLKGIHGQEYAWGHSRETLQRWIHGETDNDFINANMRELLHTGWMSNRGRQNAASYWYKTLGQDWRMGAAWFESMLLDYDVHSNWGNWMYNSGVGNDPRDRKFNPSLQAERYDPRGNFRRLWLQPTLF